jgi:hypothetical protein
MNSEPTNPYVPNPPHTVPSEAIAYIESLSPDELKLHEMAVKILGSSYFVEKSHGYLKWKASNKEN